METLEIKKDVKERIQSLQDAIGELGEKDTQVIELRKLQNAGVADNILANQEAIVLIKAYNEGWEPDWTDNSQPKYFHRFYMGGTDGSSGFRLFVCASWDSFSTVGSRLCLRSPDLVSHTGEKFLETFKRFHY